MLGAQAVAAQGILPWRLAVLFNTLERPTKLNHDVGFAKLGCSFFLNGSHISARHQSPHCLARNNGEVGNLERQLDMKTELLRGTDWSDVAEEETSKEKLQLPEEGYIGLFVRILGMDNPVEEREEAVRALWRHSMGGIDCINDIIAFPGILTLLVSLIPSTRTSSSEAAAGLLRNISSFDVHRTLVAGSGAVEELVGILTRRTLTQEVREQAANCLWNLSAEEVVRNRMDLSELLPVLWTMLDSDGSDKEAAVGILANFALNDCNHELLVDAGIIPKLANLLKSGEGSKITRQEARKVFVELVKNVQFKQMIIEDGMVPVPLIGASAYKSFKPLLDVPPALPEGLNVKPSSLSSTFGAGKLLLGLTHKDDNCNLDDATQLAIEGRARQHFLGRIGLLEKEATRQEAVAVNPKDAVTIMTWWDGIPRLVLILGLEDMKVASLAASTIADIAINEDIRLAIQKAGSIPHLVRLLGSGDEDATEAAAAALERLAISFDVRKSIDAHGTVPALVEILKADDAPGIVKEKVLMALDRLTQTGEEVQAMIQSGAFPGLLNIATSSSANTPAKQEAEGILEELSSRKVDSRKKLVDAGGIPALVQIFASGVPSMKEKAARAIENLASYESYAESIVSAGVELPLKSLLQGIVEEKVDPVTSDIVKQEETWAALAAASRLLTKLLMHEKVREIVDCRGLTLLLAQALKRDLPFHVKDWVSASLLNLDRLVGGTTSIDIPIDYEVVVYDKIPRLVNEMQNSIDPDVQEAAAIQLRDLVSQGFEGYVAAISNAGAIFPLVELLESGTPKAREAALSVLYTLGTNEENHPALIRAGVVAPLQRFVRTECSQWKLALYLLRALPV